MKRTFLILLLALSLILSACAVAPENAGKEPSAGAPATDAPVNEEIFYSSIRADWEYYADADALTERADAVFLGRVIGVDFAVLSTANGMPADETTESKSLYTLYALEIDEVYKGDVSQITHFKVDGGLMGVKEKEQVSLLRSHGLIDKTATIPIMEKGLTDIEIGESYLFAMDASLNPTLLNVLNMEQSIYPLSTPTQGIGEAAYHFSAKQLLSAIGEDAWLDFSEHWQTEHSAK